LTEVQDDEDKIIINSDLSEYEELELAIKRTENKRR
jgi:hypothetical protein